MSACSPNLNTNQPVFHCGKHHEAYIQTLNPIQGNTELR
ncbi:MAG: hypothetical protein IAF02_28645 [Anaerolineae bacterium]|nr:hypothetical protein [Anaerolineae bacterium]